MVTTDEARGLVRLGTEEKKKLAAHGRDLLEEVRAHKRALGHAGYSMGVALGKLKDKAILLALGFESFEALCNVALKISVSFAQQLIAVSEHFNERVANEIGTTKATALIGLARELGGKHTASGLLVHRELDVGHGVKVDVRAASAQSLRRVARDLRARAPREDRPGVTVPKTERLYAAQIEKALKKHGAEIAIVTVVAGPTAQGPKLRIEIRARETPLLMNALAEVKRPVG